MPQLFRLASCVVLSLVLLAPSASATLRYVYTVNADDNTISIFSVNPGTGLLRAAGYQLTGSYPKAAAIVAGKFLYVINVNANNIYGYKINAATGQLTRIAGTFATGSQPFAILVHPNGKYVYVANSASNTISAFWINATTGALTRFATYGTGVMPRALALNPTARYLYVANYGSNNVSAYVVNPNWGTLTRVAGSPFTAGSQPRDVLVEPKGTYLYVANAGSSNISAYRINATTGVPVMIGAPAPTGKTPRSLATDSNGIFLYTANRDSNNVSGFRINRSTGTLTSLVPATFGAGSQPRVVQVDPTNKLLFVGNINSRNVYTYAINSTTGVLTRSSIMQSRGQVEGMTLLSGANPVTYTPKFLYTSTNQLVGYSINSKTGALTTIALPPLDMAPSAVDPSGKLLFAEGLVNAGLLIDTYRLDQITGALTLVASFQGCAGGSMVVDATGRFLYAVGPCGLWGLRIDQSTGALTKIAGSPFDLQTFGSIAIDPTGRFLGFVHPRNGSVVLFKINTVTGALSYVTESEPLVAPNPDGQLVAFALSGLVPDASGRFFVVGLREEAGIAVLKILPSTGSLSWVEGSPFFQEFGGYTSALAADPLGKYIFYSTGDDDSSMMFRLNSNGTLTEVWGSEGAVYTSTAFDCSGKFLYTGWAFSVNRTTGAITNIAGSDTYSSPGYNDIVPITCKIQKPEAEAAGHVGAIRQGQRAWPTAKLSVCRP